MKGILTITLLLAATAAGAQINLSSNENPWGVTKQVEESIISELPNVNRYAAKYGADFVRKVAAHEGVDEDQIIIGESLELWGIYQAVKGGPGSEFIYSVPGYPAMVNAAASVGGKVVAVPLNDKKENDLKSIEAKVNGKTQALFIVNPHNPTGTVSDKQVFHDFLHRVSKKALVIVDEAYLEFSDDFDGRTALKNLKAGDNVVVFRTLAKAYGLAGLYIGYAIAPKEVAAYMKDKGLGDTHALNRLSVAAAAAALADKENLTRTTQIIASERFKWNAWLDNLHIEHTASQANFIFINTGHPFPVIHQRLLNAGIHTGNLVPAYPNWIRITIGTPEENQAVRNVIGSLTE
ncbi:histidinol-phosphate aminotransferase [Bacteroidia bacterium]|nr:histidinol-phosphate aminotransferase [Bacteroidia bacterium]